MNECYVTKRLFVIYLKCFARAGNIEQKPMILDSLWLKAKGWSIKNRLCVRKWHDLFFKSCEQIVHNARCNTISAIYTAKFTNGLWNDATPHVVILQIRIEKTREKTTHLSFYALAFHLKYASIVVLSLQTRCFWLLPTICGRAKTSERASYRKTNAHNALTIWMLQIEYLTSFFIPMFSDVMRRVNVPSAT